MKYEIDGQRLTDIGNAIREKTGKSALLTPEQMPDEISGIQSDPILQEKTATQNGVVLPDNGYDGLSRVTVSVSGIIPSGTLSISENGTYNVEAFASAVVSVQSSGGGPYDNFLIAARAKSGRIYDTEITALSSSAFSNNSFITGVEMTAVTVINGSVFYSCSSLTEAVFPVCTEIKGGAFGYNTALISISFPECQLVGHQTFQTCGKLSTVSLPKCSNLSGNVFNRCYALESLYLLSDSVALLSDVNCFQYTPMSLSSYLSGRYGSIYVPASLVDAYKSATKWSAYADRITSYVEG